LPAPSGTGKNHFVEALAHAVIDAGIKVSWLTPDPRIPSPALGLRGSRPLGAQVMQASRSDNST